MVTHCKHELMHTIWSHLMDDDFKDGYINGIVIRCSDGVKRRFYLRIILYSADYPKKWVKLYKIITAPRY